MVVVVKTEDEACGGPLHYYPFSKGIGGSRAKACLWVQLLWRRPCQLTGRGQGGIQEGGTWRLRDLEANSRIGDNLASVPGLLPLIPFLHLAASTSAFGGESRCAHRNKGNEIRKPWGQGEASRQSVLLQQLERVEKFLRGHGSPESFSLLASTFTASPAREPLVISKEVAR